MLKILSFLIAGAILSGNLVFGAGSARADEPSAAFAFYLDYLKTSATAQSIADIAPFMPSWWRARHESSDEESQAATVERVRKASQDLRDVALEKEEAVEDGVRLHLTAREQNDFPMRGTVLLMQDSGAFTVEESIWATSN